jgi:hypothetical protein
MKFKTYVLTLSAAVFTLLAMAATAAIVAETSSHESFHAAQSAPEKTLDEIIRRSNNDQNMLDYALKRPWYDAKKNTGYSRLFTKGFLAALAGVESALVKQDCKGHYVEGEICGIDYNPITCGQDSNGNQHLYQTDGESNEAVTISYLWAANDSRADSPLFRLVKDREAWKLDGVACRNGAKFNMN